MAGGQFRIRDMEIVVALHEEGNMTQAAKRLGFTEPALSKQLKEIERRIQTLLFERRNGGVVATASGRAFVGHAMESIQSFRRAIHDAHEIKHNEPNRLRIGVSTFHPLSVIQLLHSVELRLYRISPLKLTAHTRWISLHGFNSTNLIWPWSRRPHRIRILHLSMSQQIHS